MNANGPVQSPNLAALLALLGNDLLSRTNCVQIGTIVAYDPANGPKATVKINAKRIVFNQPQALDAKLQQTPQIIEYPILEDVVVMVLGGGEGFLQMPIAEGDECILLFNDRDLDVWFATGAIAVPNSARMHSLSDAIAIVGVKSLATMRDNIDAESAGLVLGTASIKIALDGTVTITGKDEKGVVTIDTDGTITVDATSAKVSVLNDSGSLKDILDALCDALKNFKDTHGDTPDPTTLAAIASVKSSVDNLLQ